MVSLVVALSQHNGKCDVVVCLHSDSKLWASTHARLNMTNHTEHKTPHIIVHRNYDAFYVAKLSLSVNNSVLVTRQNMFGYTRPAGEARGLGANFPHRRTHL